jgi:hypothetical protein
MNLFITAELEARGIVPPPLGLRRTTCPMCSHTRKKRHKRDMRIIDFDGWIELQCMHCGYTDGFQV